MQNFQHSKCKIPGSLTWLPRAPKEGVSIIIGLLNPELGNWYRITSFPEELKSAAQGRQGCKVLDVWSYSDGSHKSESEVAQSCLTLCDPVNCNLPGSSLHGILQARILEWVAISF